MASKNDFERWQDWIKEIYEKEILMFVFWRKIHGEVRDIIKKNPKIQKPSVFYDLINWSYLSSIQIAAYRQLDKHKDCTSLAKLLEEISEAPDSITRGNYIKMWQDKILASLVADGEFNQFCDKKGDDSISSSKVRNDLKKLEKRRQVHKEIRHNKLAHYNVKELKEIPFLSDVDDTIELLDELGKKYYLLLTARNMSSDITVQFNWKEIFHYPWIERT
ncbi:hypothetical protein KKH43_03575 [Patescibacteria group bacterium]|nr:hypothetical protein [Patescibacteria group bacterium]